MILRGAIEHTQLHKLFFSKAAQVLKFFLLEKIQQSQLAQLLQPKVDASIVI
mgnify:CR=1 FL=1